MSEARFEPAPGKVPLLEGDMKMVKKHWLAWFQAIADRLVTVTPDPSFTGVITTAALTSTGTTGSMTFTNGVLVDSTAAT